LEDNILLEENIFKETDNFTLLEEFEIESKL